MFLFQTFKEKPASPTDASKAYNFALDERIQKGAELWRKVGETIKGDIIQVVLVTKEKKYVITCNPQEKTIEVKAREAGTVSPETRGIYKGDMAGKCVSGVIGKEISPTGQKVEYADAVFGGKQVGGEAERKLAQAGFDAAIKDIVEFYSAQKK